MIEVLNLSRPYFGLIFVDFACGKFRKLPDTGLAWLNFFLLYISLSAPKALRQTFKGNAVA